MDAIENPDELAVFLSIDDDEAAWAFVGEHPGLLNESVLEELAARADGEVDETQAARLRGRRQLVRLARLGQDEARQDRLARLLEQWIKTPDWDSSEAFLLRHEIDLINEDAALLLELLTPANEGRDVQATFQHHLLLLQLARQEGIEAAYASLRPDALLLAAFLATGNTDEMRQLAEGLTDEVLDGLEKDAEQRLATLDVVEGEPIQERLQSLRQIRAANREMGPLSRAIMQFLTIEADDEALELLRSQPSLLSADAGETISRLADQARADEKLPEAIRERLLRRQETWLAEKQSRLGGPLRPLVEPIQSPTDREIDSTLREAVAASEERIVVVNATNSVIGPNGLVINHVGRVPLRWQRPNEIQRHLVEGAVGRAVELAELHHRLQTEGDVAVVGRGAVAALRGQPAVGKTTLAALYAATYGHLYDGGVLWLSVGYGLRTPAGAEPLVQRLASFAYEADAQIQGTLSSISFTPETVRALIGGHGRLLMVIDDVWHEEVLHYVKSALPAEASLLLTTRDKGVAFALQNSAAAIMELDVLTPGDARLLLLEKVPGLPITVADDVARGLGYHALALRLAAGALAIRGPARHSLTANEIVAAVREGRGFGDLPLIDQYDRQSQVEAALGYSYRYLGEGPRGDALQARFRSLGVFAQEGAFDAPAAAWLWQLDSVAEADETLLLFQRLALLTESQSGSGPAPRHQQHAVLRAYALSLQTTAERVDLPPRHADYYLGLTLAANRSTPREYDRVEHEFTQIAHAFTWCERESPARVVAFVETLGDFMRNRGRLSLLNRWLQHALSGADMSGNRLGKANTLQSLGDLESRLGNIPAARAHYDAALPLYEAEQARLGKANTLQSLGDLERRLGNIPAARAHYDAALPLYEAEQAPIGQINVFMSLNRLERVSGDDAQAQANYQRAIALAEKIDFADHPIVAAFRRENENAGASDIEDEGIDAAFKALFSMARDEESFRATLTAHPVLRERQTLELLTDLVEADHAQGQTSAAAQLMGFLILLFNAYNEEHVEAVDPDSHAKFMALHERLLPIAQSLLDPQRAEAVRDSAAWAGNTLGNQYAADGDKAGAVAAYSRALDMNPNNAMIRRNRADTFIDLREFARARADLELSAALEPDAARLPVLWQRLEQEEAGNG